jgi:hypothetical protein
MNRITYIGFVLALSTVLLGSPAGAQTTAQNTSQTTSQTQDQSSLGDYARKIHKDPGAAKSKPKVFDNDNLPTDDKLSIVGEQLPANAGGAAPAEEKDAAKPAGSPEEEQAKKQAAWKSWQDKLTTQKDQNDLASRELDVLQREYQLRAAAMYADAGNRMRNSGEWDKEDAQYKQRIADKQKIVDEGKQKLGDMQEEARKAGVPSSMVE